MKSYNKIKNNLIIGIILSFLFISCEDSPELSYDITFDMRLNEDGNGYYHLTLDRNKWQTLHRVSGSVANTQYRLENFWIEWESNLYWYIGDTLGYVVKRGLTDDLVYVGYDTTYITWFNGYEVPIVNSASYSREDGEVNTMIAPVKTMVGDTATIYYGYHDPWTYEDTYGEFYVIFD